MKLVLILFIVWISISNLSLETCSAGELMVHGDSFSILATQQIKFVPLMQIAPESLTDPDLPPVVDLKSDQSKVKNQGPRGACTYFVTTSLIESIIKKASGNELDLSEEYLAYAAKSKKKMRIFEEDSSIAVNAATFQEFGFILEENLPYQQSWFDKGMPCEGQKDRPNIAASCYSHDGPKSETLIKVIDGKNFIFQSVDSSSLDLVRSLAQNRTAVTASIQGHPTTWENSKLTGELILTSKLKKECQTRPKLCSGHAVLIVGYDIPKRTFTFKNSWGDQWGDKGYGTISFDSFEKASLFE